MSDNELYIENNPDIPKNPTFAQNFREGLKALSEMNEEESANNSMVDNALTVFAPLSLGILFQTSPLALMFFAVFGYFVSEFIKKITDSVTLASVAKITQNTVSFAIASKVAGNDVNIQNIGQIAKQEIVNDVLTPLVNESIQNNPIAQKWEEERETKKIQKIKEELYNDEDYVRVKIPLMDVLSDDRVYHRLFIGGTGSGKTVLANALGRKLKEQGHEIIVIDLKSDSLPNKRGGKWYWADHVFGYGGAINHNGLNNIHDGVKFALHQYNERANFVISQGNQFENKFFVLIDEINVLTQLASSKTRSPIKGFEDDLRELFTLYLRLGREYGCEIIVIGQDMNGFNLPGCDRNKALLFNFGYITRSLSFSKRDKGPIFYRANVMTSYNRLADTEIGGYSVGLMENPSDMSTLNKTGKLRDYMSEQGYPSFGIYMPKNEEINGIFSNLGGIPIEIPEKIPPIRLEIPVENVSNTTEVPPIIPDLSVNIPVVNSEIPPSESNDSHQYLFLSMIGAYKGTQDSDKKLSWNSMGAVLSYHGVISRSPNNWKSEINRCCKQYGELPIFTEEETTVKQ